MAAALQVAICGSRVMGATIRMPRERKREKMPVRQNDFSGARGGGQKDCRDARHWAGAGWSVGASAWVPAGSGSVSAPSVQLPDATWPEA